MPLNIDAIYNLKLRKTSNSTERFTTKLNAKFAWRQIFFYFTLTVYSNRIHIISNKIN
jgi:hypothetical protein